MTLDRVTVDLARAFEPSQVYVARKYEHLYMTQYRCVLIVAHSE